MLSLKKVQILGFKSFCDRTEVELAGRGIAAIVGPNGCGKSNISDAITWVLGEQSAKSLRGIKMEDVIFAGTRDRKPLGMAEVSLTLVDPEVYDAHGDMGPELVLDGHSVVADGHSVAADGHSVPADWDESALRASRAEETEEAIADAQPGTTYEAKVPKKRRQLAENATPEEISAAAEAVEEDDEERGGHPDIHAAVESETEVEADAAAAHAPDNNVVLKIRRRKFGRAPLRAGEITVTRRLFRSGDSEYLLNGKICRLRDIQDIFMGTGLGGESYAIIGQERIGQLLSSKPLDRRAIIEEAAGITRFKTKKRLAELRLESAKQNLSRVNDIFEEVTRQMGSLKRQAAKAERYQSVQTELRDKLRVVLASRLAQMDAEQAAAATEIARLGVLIDAQAASLETLDAEHTAGVAHGYELDGHIRESGSRASQAAVELERIAARTAANTDRIGELAERSAAAQQDLAHAQGQLATLAGELEQHRSFLENATTEADTSRAAADHHRQQAQHAGHAVAEAESGAERARHASMQAMQRAAQARSEEGNATAALSGLEAESERLTTESSRAQAELESLGHQRGQIRMSFESVTERLQRLEAEIVDLRSQLDTRRSEETQSRRRADELRAEMATMLGRRGSLEALIREHSYSTDTVKNIFRANEHRDQQHASALAPVGTLADFLEVDGRYEAVVDEFLRDELNYIVVKSWDAADEGMRMLQSDVAGRATFLVHPNDSQAAFPFADGMRASSDPNREGVIPLKDCIRVLDGFGRSLEVILPKLREGFIAPDNATARNLALSNPQSFFLSPSGETFNNVMVTSGRAREQGPLALKRELAELQQKIEAIETELSHASTATLTLERQIADLNATLESRSTERRDAERESANSGAALRQMESETARIEQRLHEWHLAAERNRDAQQQKRDLIGRKQEEGAQLDAAHAAADAQLAEVTGHLSTLRSARDEAQQAAAAAAAALAGFEERRRNANANFAQTERLFAGQQQRLAQIDNQLAVAATETLRREEENAAFAAQHETLTAARLAAVSETEALTAEAAELRTHTSALDAQLRTLRHETEALREDRSQLSARAAKLTSDVEHMEATCLNDLSIEASALREDDSIARLEGEALTTEDETARALKQRLEAMGPVNMMALEEYTEIAERHSFLETQRTDLLDSIENTQASIKEIDDVSRVKFDEAFKVINENFSTTFTKLFGGGQGFMRLTDPDAANASESGIDIVASPPGKKLQNVLLLSGGEKALTALSLLVGIFQFQPAPFCVLDEVDAPLDETNVGRFARLIAEMAQTTQFVVITHSKRTMEQADVMYGVTMQEPGVSKIVSVSLNGKEHTARTTRAAA